MTPPAPNDLALFCPNCGYDVRATTADRCPECGELFDRATLSVSTIPWLHRRQIGRVRAYWRTVRMVIRRPSEVGKQAAKL